MGLRKLTTFINVRHMKQRDFRKAHRMTQAEFARRIGVHSVTVSLYETGKQLPSASTMRRIREEFGGVITFEDYLDAAVLRIDAALAKPTDGHGKSSSGDGTSVGGACLDRNTEQSAGCFVKLDHCVNE
jgi:DNA-binding XRE family transcriptional regulator